MKHGTKNFIACKMSWRSIHDLWRWTYLCYLFVRSAHNWQVNWKRALICLHVWAAVSSCDLLTVQRLVEDPKHQVSHDFVLLCFFSAEVSKSNSSTLGFRIRIKLEKSRSWDRSRRPQGRRRRRCRRCRSQSLSWDLKAPDWRMLMSGVVVKHVRWSIPECRCQFCFITSRYCFYGYL